MTPATGTAYYIAWGLCLVLSLGVPAVLIEALAEGMRRAGRSTSERTQFRSRAWLTLVIWLGITGTASVLGFFRNWDALPPRPVFLVLPPLLFLIFLLRRRPRLREAAARMPASIPLYLQVFRIPVEIFLWLLFLSHVLPEQMTFEGLNFDIISGILGPLVALGAISIRILPRFLAVLYNYIGLALLLNIVTIAILSMPTPLRVFTNEPANYIVGEFPFVWLPAVLVPCAYYLHVFSLLSLRDRRN